ncbi:MAG: hypothetical protein PHC66_03805 [Candidatus Nanoarchaeia archaeon]|nr:hypothetical protein [Candidatus Nanoarchaeia archaeon]MDD5239220.1 hypothetical protein [Candidatus Nanoarchaeia archaeon]
MSVITEVLSTVWDVLKAIVPSGVEPILFFTTFLITAVLVFSIVQLIEFFKTNRPLALISAVVIGYFTASSVFVTIMVSKLFPNIGLAIMAILGVMLVLVFLAPNKFKDKGMGISIPIAIAVFAVIIWLTWVFAAPALESAGILSQIRGVTGFGITNEDVAVVIVALVIIGGLYFLFKGPDTNNAGFLKVTR